MYQLASRVRLAHFRPLALLHAASVVQGRFRLRLKMHAAPVMLEHSLKQAPLTVLFVMWALGRAHRPCHAQTAMQGHTPQFMKPSMLACALLATQGRGPSVG